MLAVASFVFSRETKDTKWKKQTRLPYLLSYAEH
jgi:hypothetical protein